MNALIRNVKRKARGFWDVKQNQRAFLDGIANKYNIREPKDWGSIRTTDVMKHNGVSLILKHNGSLIETLKAVYPENVWKPEWFSFVREHPKQFWTDTQNQRHFLEEVGKSLGISHPKDWGSVSVHQIEKKGGGNLFYIHGKSLFHILRKVFPETKWEVDWFINKKSVERGYWTLKKNQIKFLRNFASTYGIESPRDWGKITNRMIVDAGGSRILDQYGTIQRALKELFIETNWKVEWFPRIHKYRESYWNSVSNQREFMENISLQYNINHPNDWSRVSVSLILKNGGKGLLMKYGNSLKAALEYLYPYLKNSLNTGSQVQRKLVKTAVYIVH